MKRIVLIITAICICMYTSAQNEYDSSFVRFYVPNSDGSLFPVPIDTSITIVEDGKTYIKIHANNPYNAQEFSDYQKYAILKGDNIYLKLDNEEIITLTCAFNIVQKDGYVTTRNGVYQNYADYSYFLIDTEVIEKLKKYDIIKVRGQFKFELMDGSMQFSPESKIHKTKESFTKAEQMVQEKYKKAKSNDQMQKTLKENPLYNF